MPSFNENQNNLNVGSNTFPDNSDLLLVSEIDTTSPHRLPMNNDNNRQAYDMPMSTIKTADLNLDHDIAGEIDAMVDSRQLESKNKYAFMGFGEIGNSGQKSGRGFRPENTGEFNDRASTFK